MGWMKDTMFLKLFLINYFNGNLYNRPEGETAFFLSAFFLEHSPNVQVVTTEVLNLSVL